MALVPTRGLSVLEARDEVNKMQGGQFGRAFISASQKSPETKRRQISPFLQPWLRSALSDVPGKDSANTRDCESASLRDTFRSAGDFRNTNRKKIQSDLVICPINECFSKAGPVQAQRCRRRKRWGVGRMHRCWALTLQSLSLSQKDSI